MKNIFEMGIIQIDITNACVNSCSNCTRFCGHYTKDRIYFMDKNYFIDALISLKDFNGIVGIIGGEPTLHPLFLEFCEIFKQLRPDKNKRGLWSNTYGNFQKYYDVIQDTFGYFNLNDHISNEIIHTPILVSSEKLISDDKERFKLIDSCWIQNYWSASINTKGAFFCEVAGMLSYLFNGIDGLNIKENPDWWKKPISEYKYQINWACNKCGGAIPLIPRRSTSEIDDVSEDLLLELKKINSPKINKGLYSIYDNKKIDYSQYRDIQWYWNFDKKSF